MSNEDYNNGLITGLAMGLSPITIIEGGGGEGGLFEFALSYLPTSADWIEVVEIAISLA